MVEGKGKVKDSVEGWNKRRELDGLGWFGWDDGVGLVWLGLFG